MSDIIRTFSFLGHYIRTLDRLVSLVNSGGWRLAKESLGREHDNNNGPLWSNVVSIRVPNDSCVKLS